MQRWHPCAGAMPWRSQSERTWYRECRARNSGFSLGAPGSAAARQSVKGFVEDFFARCGISKVSRCAIMQFGFLEEEK